jgi:hypothetical protein
MRVLRGLSCSPISPTRVCGCNDRSREIHLPGSWAGVVSWPDSSSDRDNREAQLFGLALEVLDGALAIFLFEKVSAGVDVFGLISEHGIDDTNEFVGGGSDGGRGVGACSDAAEKGAEIRIAVGEGSGSQTQSLGPVPVGPGQVRRDSETFWYRI